MRTSSAPVEKLPLKSAGRRDSIAGSAGVYRARLIRRGASLMHWRPPVSAHRGIFQQLLAEAPTPNDRIEATATKGTMVEFKAYIAYHEAGHAVASWRLRIPLRRAGVTIIPDADTGGSVSHHRVISKDIEYDCSDRNRLKAERMAQVCLAGHIAQRRFNPRSVRNYHSQADRHAAIHVLSYVSGSTREVEAWLKLLHIRTEQMLFNEHVWRSVERLADALMQRGRLSGPEATDIICTAFFEALKLSSRLEDPEICILQGDKNKAQETAKALGTQYSWHELMSKLSPS